MNEISVIRKLSKKHVSKSFDVSASIAELTSLAKTVDKFDRKQRKELHALVIGVQRTSLAVFRTLEMKDVVDRELKAKGVKLTAGGGYPLAIMRMYVGDRHKAARLARAIKGAIASGIGPDRLRQKLRKKKVSLSQLEESYRLAILGGKIDVTTKKTPSTPYRQASENYVEQDEAECQFRIFGVAERARTDIRYQTGRALAIIDVQSRNRVSIRRIAFESEEAKRLFARWAN